MIKHKRAGNYDSRYGGRSAEAHRRQRSRTHTGTGQRVALMDQYPDKPDMDRRGVAEGEEYPTSSRS